jgi:PAS domain S-box-containing protein
MYIGAASGRPVIALEVPVLRPDGSVMFCLTLSPTVDPFAEIFRRTKFDEDAIIALLDRVGIIIARTPNDEAFIGQPAGAVLPLLLTQSEGIVETTSKEGVPVVAAFSHVPIFGWSVSIGLPRAKLTAAAVRASLVTFSVGTSCLALGLWLAQRMAWRIAQPIASLRELTVALERDIPVTTAATGLAETDDVARALVAAAQKRRMAETATHHAEQERVRAAELLHTVLETAPNLIYARDRAGRMVLANDAFLRLLGKPWAEVVGRTELEFHDNQTEAEATVGNDRRIMASDQAEACEELMGMEGDEPRVWLSTKTPFRNAKGDVIGLVGVSVEITERKQIETQLRLMVAELNHRVKNTLATVQSIAFHTLRGSDRTVQRTLEARLQALATAHDVLTREGWAGASLTEVVAAVLTPHGGMADGRFHVSGPPLRLQPRAAVALAMGLHELTTNALKYGALLVEGGIVEITWAVVPGTVPHLQLTWLERNGPPVLPPGEAGFGTRLLGRGLAQDFGGTVQIAFGVAGITCVLDAPLAGVVAPASGVAFPHVGQMQGKWG